MRKETYAQGAAAVVAGYFAKIDVRPNHVTALSLFLALSGAGLLALAEAWALNLGAGLFVAARFLDSVDGRLARLEDRRTTFGYYFDYVTGALSYSALFIGMGIGLSGGILGIWSPVLGAAGAASALLAAYLNIDLDRRMDLSGGESVGYPVFAGFALEDGIFLIAPVAWLGWLAPFLVLAGTGAVIYCLWTLTRLRTTSGAGLRPGQATPEKHEHKDREGRGAQAGRGQQPVG